MPVRKVDPATSGKSHFDYIDIASIDNENQRIVEPKRYSSEDAPSRARQEVRAHDVVFSTVRTYLKNIALVPEYLDGQIASTGFSVLRASNATLPKYLFYYSLTPSFLNALAELQRGTSYPAVRDGDVRAQRIPLAPLPEQRRIVAKIEELFSRLDAGVAALKRVQAALKRYKASVLKAACEGRLVPQDPSDEPADVLVERILEDKRGLEESSSRSKSRDRSNARVGFPQRSDYVDLPKLPQGWCWTTFGSIGDVQGGIQKQPKRAPTRNHYPYLRVANVLRGRLDLSEVLSIELFDDELSKLRLKRGDLLIVEGNGSQTEIGRSAIWRGEIENCVHQNHIIRARFSGIDPSFADYYLNSPMGAARISSVASSTSGLFTLSTAKIKAIPMPVPPLAEQKKIVAEIERQLSIILKLERTIDLDLSRAVRLRQSILARAFNGTLCL